MINIWDRMEGGEGEGGEAAACPPRGAASGERCSAARACARSCRAVPRKPHDAAAATLRAATARPMLRRADVRRDSRFGGLAARFRRIAVSPYRRIAVSPYRRIATSPIRHVADSTPAVRRARNMAAHRAKPRVAAEQRDTLDTPRA
ncbi:hypothetical protein [Burkholderia pseudomallei]|uniref:hypothetical protein n=2 Tax=Burkholderia pseudomallei TaxID=28450 RepID=UPI001604D434|nr:hypothetical protein [Burkholderia pseudomallei]MDV2125060.1 hypothetical protein [Burkholderia pseudomallei]MDV2231200.1 hypothetical protein [Burkholderia pseudomallei]QUN97006.1 hypothetical protein KEX44_29625 [Burkholderia pseudomallei]